MFVSFTTNNTRIRMVKLALKITIDIWQCIQISNSMVFIFIVNSEYIQNTNAYARMVHGTKQTSINHSNHANSHVVLLQSALEHFSLFMRNVLSRKNICHYFFLFFHFTMQFSLEFSLEFVDTFPTARFGLEPISNE